MANEINMQAILTVQRTGLSIQGSGNVNVDQDSGSSGIARLQSFTASTTTGTAISLEGLTFPSSRGFLFLKNTHATNFIEISVVNTDQTAFNGSAFAKLQPGEFCLVPINTSKTYYARANTATITLMIAAVAK